MSKNNSCTLPPGFLGYLIDQVKVICQAKELCVKGYDWLMDFYGGVNMNIHSILKLECTPSAAWAHLVLTLSGPGADFLHGYTTINNSGPSTVPWETPKTTSVQIECCPLIMNIWMWRFRKLEMHTCVLLWIPYLYNLLNWIFKKKINNVSKRQVDVLLIMLTPLWQNYLLRHGIKSWLSCTTSRGSENSIIIMSTWDLNRQVISWVVRVSWNSGECLYL